MYDLNNANDVIAQMRDGEMTDEAIIRVCKQVITTLEVANATFKKQAVFVNSKGKVVKA